MDASAESSSFKIQVRLQDAAAINLSPLQANFVEPNGVQQLSRHSRLAIASIVILSHNSN